ncbi:heparan-alpha-glucosaminide N-acetyltransferase domain-containing protein [Paucibacter sp. TC2R-5]|uniref:acyltransferase family protein n=1 Tax=Paucibacter sp. TC2R-5 TaxID=2893555 RepID=UPI0021E3FA74|nr:heparan-alpha-glucosaminide N-acetyltransferase domain-containing protein [Paucibacter sp. TC2R-5]MCV2360245.1 heparan-alpha-glucosaminide N-acetyltransferase domain-containing protein [Paucibacter sp. TC2R-5]
MKQRLLSLDAFRGFTIAAMLLVNNPGDWAHLYPSLAHAKWHGWTFTDWVFPFFVFICGNSMSISLTRRIELGDEKLLLLRQTARRALLIIALGLLLNFIPSFSLSELRIPGVLQRLGLCTLLAAPIVLWCGWRAQLWWAVGLLVGYSLIQLYVPVPDAQGIWHRGSLLPGEDVGAWLDRALLDGHLWQHSKTWDPEGLLSTLPALAGLLAGALTGQWLLSKREPSEKPQGLMVAGLACLGLGELLNVWLMPINKSLWTPSYAVAMTGWALLIFVVFYWLLDAMPSARWRSCLSRGARPLLMLGMNALFIFTLSGLLAKLLGHWQLSKAQTLKAWLYGPILALEMRPENASLLYALAFTAVLWLMAWALWARRCFIKI